jgi:signal transduction histidine kinase
MPHGALVQFETGPCAGMLWAVHNGRADAAVLQGEQMRASNTATSRASTGPLDATAFEAALRSAVPLGNGARVEVSRLTPVAVEFPDLLDRPPPTVDRPSDRLLAELCHDLRQPLTTIKMNLQAVVRLLQRRKPCIAEALEAIADCVEAEQDVVELLAGMTRPVTPELSYTSRIGLNSIAADVRAALSLGDPRLGKRIALRLAPRSPTVDGDAPRLRLALLSLVRHALDWKGRDRVRARLVVGTRQMEARAELSVAGVPLPLVLGPSLHTTLSVMFSVVRAHGAVARIDPRPAGATVRIVFPRKPPPTGSLRETDHDQ